MTGRCRSITHVLGSAVLLVAGAYMESAIAADAPSVRVPDLRRIYVPADAPRDWPAGDWQPIPLAELERLHQAAQSATGRSQLSGIDRAEYSAVLSGDSLTAGELHWIVRHATDEPAPIALDPLSLATSEMVWALPGGARPAIWGADSTGGRVLLPEARASSLTGRWTLPGQKLAHSVQFELQFAPAVVTRLTLRAPAGTILTANAGELVGPQPADSSPWALWTLNLGSQTRCRLRATRQATHDAAAPLLLVAERANYVVSPEGLRWRTEFEPQVLEGEVRRLELQLDAGMQTTSIVYGDDGSLKWEPVAEQGALRIDLPDVLRSPGQRVTVRGIAPIPKAGGWKLPRVRVRGALEAGAEAVVRLQNPFQAADIRLHGYRQIDFRSTPEGETISLRQFRTDASVTLFPERPDPRFAARSASVVRTTGSEWVLTAQVDFQAAAATLQTVECRVPRDWKLTDVRPAPGEPADSLKHWELGESPDGDVLLRLQFQGGLDPEAPRRIRVEAHRPAPALNEAVPLPAIPGVHTADSMFATLIVSGPNERPLLERAVLCDTVLPDELPPEIRDIDFVRQALDEAPAETFAVLGTAADSAATVSLRSARATASFAALPGDSRAVRTSIATPAPDLPASPAVPLVLQSATRLAADSGFDRYYVQVSLRRGRPGARLVWRLDERCELTQVRLNGQLLRPKHEGFESYELLDDRSLLPFSRNAEPEKLELEYRMPAEAAPISEARDLCLPRFESPVLRYEMTVVVPPELRLVPGGPVAFERISAEDMSLTGPLARFVQRRLLNPVRHPAVWRASGSAMPTTVALRLWSAPSAVCLSWTLGSLACLLATLARVVPFRRGRVLGLLALGVSLAMLLPGSVYAEFAFAVVLGLVTGLLLPQRWLVAATRRRLQSSPGSSGSTQSFAPALARLILALLLTGVTAARAQVPPAVSPPAGGQSASARRIDVLIPVDAASQPAGREPIAYVAERDLARLNREMSRLRAPAWLIQAAQVSGRLETAARLLLTVEYEVLVLATDETVRIELPTPAMAPGGLRGCLVDGQPAASLGASSREKVWLDVPGAAPGAGAKAGPVAAHRIELAFVPSIVERKPGSFSASIPIPSAGQSSATVAQAPGLPQVELIRSLQIAEAAADDKALPEAGQPHAGRWQFHWSVAPPGDGPAEIAASVWAVVEVAPGIARTEMRAVYELGERPVNSLPWQLPSGARVQSVRAARLSGTVLERESPAGRRLWLEFSGPLPATVEVEATIVQPIPVDAPTFPLRLPDVEGRSFAGPVVALKTCLVGFRHPAPFNLSVGDAGSGLITRGVPVDEIAEDLADEAPRPQQAFELSRAGTLELTLQEISERLPAQFESRGRISRGRVAWTFLAEVARPEIPRFQYRATIDPELRIESVSVEEDGAERLWRWSQNGDSLVLFLNDRVTRSVTIRIDAHRPLDDPAEFTIPWLLFEDVQPRSRRVILRRTRDVEVTLLKNIPAAIERPAQAGGPANDVLVGAFDLGADAATPTVRVAAASPRPDAQLLVFAPGARSDSLEIAVSYAREDRLPTVCEIDLPADVARGASVQTSEAARFVEETSTAGRTRLLVFPARSAAGPLDILVRTRTDPGQHSTWPIPAVELPGADVRSRALIMPPGAFVTSAAGSAPLTPAQLPEWLRGRPEAGGLRTDVQILELPAVAESLEVHWPVAARRSAALPLVDFGVEISQGGTVHGRVLAWLPENAASPLEFAWPADARPQLALIDGTALEVPVPQQGRLRVAWPAGLAPRLLFLMWTASFSDRLPLAAPIDVPWPVNADVSQALLTSRTAPGMVQWGRPRGSDDPEAVEPAVLRWQAAIDALERPMPTSPELAAALRNYIDAQERYASLAASRSVAAPAGALQARLQELQVRTRTLAGAERTPALAFFDETLSLPFSPGQRRETATAVRLEPDPNLASTPRAVYLGWIIDQRLLTGLLAALAVIAIFVSGRALARAIAWLQSRPALCLLGLGLPAWYLSGQVLLFLACGMLAAFEAWRRPRARVTASESAGL